MLYTSLTSGLENTSCGFDFLPELLVSVFFFQQAIMFLVLRSSGGAIRLVEILTVFYLRMMTTSRDNNNPMISECRLPTFTMSTSHGQLSQDVIIVQLNV